MEDKKTLLIYGGVFLIVLFVLYTVFKRIGLIKSSEDEAKTRKATALQTSESEYFTPTYYKQFPSRVLLSDSLAKDIATNLHVSMFSTNLLNVISLGTATLGTDTEKFFSALNKIKSKAQFSQVADVFDKSFNKDLYTSILGELNENELIKFDVKISSLPNS